MQAFPGVPADPHQLRSTMIAFEQACALIQAHLNPAEAEKVIASLHESSMPYQACKFILETSSMPNARFQAAGAIGDAAIREWGLLTYDNKRSLILFCLAYIMEHASACDGYVQAKVSSVAARLLKRGWLEFSTTDIAAIFFEIKQSIMGTHGMNLRYAGITFLESLVAEFSPSTSSALRLPREFHEQCEISMELNYLKDFYCWAQACAISCSEKTNNVTNYVSDEKACSAALRLMFQILNWNFRYSDREAFNTQANSNSRPDIGLKKFENSFVKPGPKWNDSLISGGHTAWLLNLYDVLRQKFSSDTLWSDSPIAVTARQLIVQLCSLTGAVFPSDNGETQTKHLVQILSTIVKWIEPTDAIVASIRNGGSESEFIDGCHVLLSMATLTEPSAFDNLLKSVRPYGTISLLASLTAEAVKAVVSNRNEEETWGSESLELLLETWNVIYEKDVEQRPISTDATAAASSLFNVIVESHLKAAADSAHEDADDAEYFHASVSKRDEELSTYALIARAAPELTVPFLAGLFSERFTRLNQRSSEIDITQTLEELYWLLLMTSHVLTDSVEGETLLIPEALLAGFSNVAEAVHHPVVALSWTVINFCQQCMDPDTRSKYFSPRLMEAVVWFLARWVATYLSPVDVNTRQTDRSVSDLSRALLPQNSIKILVSFAWEHNQGEVLLDFVVRVSQVVLSLYPGETELQTLTCQKLLATVVRHKHLCACLVRLDSWRDLARKFANDRSLFTINGRLQRSLAETLVCAASSIKDSEASVLYLRDLMGPITSCLVENAARSDLRSVAQQADVVYLVSCLLERLRGAVRATHPCTQRAIFEMGCAVMNSLLVLLDIYKNQSAVVYLIIKFVVDFVDGQVAFLGSRESSILVSFCLQLLQLYSSNNIAKNSVSTSSSLRNEAQAEKYKDLRALIQLLTNICSKDMVGFLSSGDHDDKLPDIAEVIYLGLHILTPLMSVDLLNYPKLSRDYFTLLSHLLEIYPEKLACLERVAFSRIVGTLDYGVRHLDTDVVEKCLAAIGALASFHYKERNSGKDGLVRQLVESDGPNGALRESISGHFLRLLLQILLFEDFRMDLAGAAADALLPLLMSEHELYQKLVQELLEREQNPALIARLGNAFQNLTSSNNLSQSLDRPNKQKFRKNLRVFLVEISNFMRIK